MTFVTERNDICYLEKTHETQYNITMIGGILLRSSYRPEDVTILLKDITGLVDPMENIDRERMIQSGVHYSEMIPREHLPS